MLSKIRSLLEITDFTVEEIDELVALAMDIIANPKKYADVCKSKKLATLFYEPSTRTRLSFTAAMMELGGNVLGFSDAAASSVSKGEVFLRRLALRTHSTLAHQGNGALQGHTVRVRITRRTEDTRLPA